MAIEKATDAIEAAAKTLSEKLKTVLEKWIEFKVLKNNLINVSIIEAEKKLGIGRITTIPPENIIHSDWANEIVSFDEMYNEITTKAEEYIREVQSINKELANGQTFTELKKLLLEVKQANK